jgi:hypothetical protein
MGHERIAETGRKGRGPGWVLLGLLPLLGLGVLLAFIVLNGAGIERKGVPPCGGSDCHAGSPAHGV